MNDSIQSPLNQDSRPEKVLNINGPQEIIPLLIEAGILKEEIIIDELGSMLVPVQYQGIVAALCPIPEYYVEEQPVWSGFEHLRLQHKFNVATNEISLLKEHYPEVITRYEVATLKRDYYLDKVSPVKKIKPRSLSELRTAMFANIDKNYERGLKGIRVKSFPDMNDKLLGLHGLICLTAGPNAGKTVLATQLVLEALAIDQTVCGLIVSLEMDPETIAERLYRLCSDMSYKELRFKYKNPEYTLHKDRADRLFEQFSSRLLIVGEDDCPDLTVELLIEMIRDLKESSGCKKIITVIDYLQIWPTAGLHNKSLSEIERDKWFMQQLKVIRRAYPDDATLVIAESRKPKTGEAWAVDLADLSGSGRFTYGFDTVMHINTLNDKKLLRLAEKNGIDLKGDKVELFLQILEEELLYRGSVLCNISVSKVRDGGAKFTNLAEFNYHKDIFSLATSSKSGDILEYARAKTFRNCPEAKRT